MHLCNLPYQHYKKFPNTYHILSNFLSPIQQMTISYPVQNIRNINWDNIVPFDKHMLFILQ